MPKQTRAAEASCVEGRRRRDTKHGTIIDVVPSDEWDQVHSLQLFTETARRKAYSAKSLHEKAKWPLKSVSLCLHNCCDQNGAYLCARAGEPFVIFSRSMVNQATGHMGTSPES